MPMLGQLINPTICCPRQQNDGINSWMDRGKNELMDRWADNITIPVDKYHLILTRSGPC